MFGLAETGVSSSKQLAIVANALTPLAPHTTIAEFANTVDPDEISHNELSHLDPQCLPSSL